MYASRLLIAAVLALNPACAPDMTEPADPPANPETAPPLQLPRPAAPTLGLQRDDLPLLLMWNGTGYTQVDTNFAFGAHDLPRSEIESINVIKGASASAIHTSTGHVMWIVTRR